MVFAVTQVPLAAPTACVGVDTGGDSSEVFAKSSVETLVKERGLTWASLLLMAQKSLDLRETSNSKFVDSGNCKAIRDLADEWNPTCKDLEKCGNVLKEKHQSDGNCMFYALHEACSSTKLECKQSAETSVDICSLRKLVVQSQMKDLSNRCAEVSSGINADIAKLVRLQMKIAAVRDGFAFKNLFKLKKETK
jgi:hypothetical protein